MYLHDADGLELLVKARESLMVTNKLGKKGDKKSGLLFVKESIVPDPHFWFNSEENAVSRTIEHYELMFEAAGLTILA